MIVKESKIECKKKKEKKKKIQNIEWIAAWISNALIRKIGVEMKRSRFNVVEVFQNDDVSKDRKQNVSERKSTVMIRMKGKKLN